MYYKSTLQLHPISEYTLQGMWSNDHLKVFPYSDHNPSAPQVLQGGSNWEEEEEKEEKESGFPSSGFCCNEEVRKYEVIFVVFHLYTVLSNAYNINSVGFFWARTQNVFPANNVFTNMFIDLHSNLTITSKD